MYVKILNITPFSLSAPNYRNIVPGRHLANLATQTNSFPLPRLHIYNWALHWREPSTRRKAATYIYSCVVKKNYLEILDLANVIVLHAVIQSYSRVNEGTVFSLVSRLTSTIGYDTTRLVAGTIPVIQRCHDTACIHNRHIVNTEKASLLPVNLMFWEPHRGEGERKVKLKCYIEQEDKTLNWCGSSGLRPALSSKNKWRPTVSWRISSPAC